MRAAVALVALLTATPAFAGGIAPIVTGGFHMEDVYYYTRTNPDTGVDYPSPAEYPQEKVSQAIGNIGSGLELILGDRDDMIQGVFRGYWMMDAAQTDPTRNASAGTTVVNYRDKARHVGVGSVGIQIGVFRAAEDRFKLGVSTHVGTGFLTTDGNGYFLGQVGLNAGYKVNRTLEVFVDVDYGLRVQKTLSHGVYGTAGLRVLFD